MATTVLRTGLSQVTLRGSFQGQQLPTSSCSSGKVSKVVRFSVRASENGNSQSSNGNGTGALQNPVLGALAGLWANVKEGGGVRLGKNLQPVLTTGAGQPVEDDNAVITSDEKGHMTMEDFHFFDKQAHMNRERVPERVVHANGVGAHGYFETTNDLSDISKAGLFQGGKRTPIFVRFSTVTGERGFADTARDVRGFSIKFYTEDGNWDLVANNTPVFWVRDPLKFPDLVHSQKRNPQTNLKDANAFWDFLSLVPESVHQTLITFGPRGVPDGYRHMNGYGSHTFKMVNSQGKPSWVKFHIKTDQGVKNIAHERALEIAGFDPDYAVRDLYEHIQRGQNPSWTFCVQVMPVEDADNYKFDPFDLTKVWSKKDYPLREVGKLVLDRLPENFFNEVEQVAFSPSHMVSGIEPSPDRILQSRLFAYDDAARYRVGTNFLQLPINACPFAKVQNYQRDGAMSYSDNGGSQPNYYPNSFPDLPRPDPSQPLQMPYKHEGGTVGRYMPQRWKNQDDFEQPRQLWNLLPEEDKTQTVSNIAGHLSNAIPPIQIRQLSVFRMVSDELADRLESELKNKIQSPEPATMIA